VIGSRSALTMNVQSTIFLKIIPADNYFISILKKKADRDRKREREIESCD